MAFRNKIQYILYHNPDVLIVPECEHPGKFNFTLDTPVHTCFEWFGTNHNKGLGVFSFGSFKLKILAIHNPLFKMVVPIEVTGGGYNFTLFAIWANNPGDPDGTYVEQVWKAINYYESLLSSPMTMLAGDFNSNSIWDRKHRLSNHSNVVEKLEGLGIVSSYHFHNKQLQGQEEHPTLYMYRKKEKGYHIDYCFMSEILTQKIKSVEIGDFKYWTQFSDHTPLIVTLS
jgi:exodeoxyribonuclease III